MLKFFFAVMLFLWAGTSVVFAAEPSCPPNVDPLYCQVADATGGHVLSSSDEMATTILTQMEEAKTKRERQYKVYDVLQKIGVTNLSPVAIFIFFLASTPLWPLLGGLMAHLSPPGSRHQSFLLSLGMAFGPFIFFFVMITLFETELSRAGVLLFSLLPGSLFFVLAYAFSRAVKGNKKALWAAALLQATGLSFLLYQILFNGMIS